MMRGSQSSRAPVAPATEVEPSDIPKGPAIGPWAEGRDRGGGDDDGTSDGEEHGGGAGRVEDQEDERERPDDNREIE